jgi:hypothetical protein
MAAKEIWIIGESQHSHFAAPLDWLQEHASCRIFPAIDSALIAILESVKSSDPDAVLLVQSRPGQISRRDVERLYAQMPLTRLIGLAGPWCEGEGRTGRPWPGVIRVPWRDWRWRLLRELGLGDEELSTAARLPRTATEADRLQQSIANLSLRFAGNVELVTTSRANFVTWQAALQLFGVHSFWAPASSNATGSQAGLQIIDGWENVSPIAEPVDSASVSMAPVRVLLLHFPRPDDVSRAACLGIATVLAQPMLLADLAVALDGLFGRVGSTAYQPAA